MPSWRVSSVLKPMMQGLVRILDDWKEEDVDDWVVEATR
jgi:hypothetical protein